MVILLSGASHTGKTRLAQQLMEHLHIPYLSIDHLKMGLIRSGQTTLSRSQIDRLLPEDFLLTDRLDSVSLPSDFQSYTSLLTTLIGKPSL